MNDSGISPRRIVEACMDFASAVSKKNRYDLIERYEEVMQVGRLGHFLQSLRSEVEGVPGASESKISLARLRKRAGLFGLNFLSIANLKLPSGEAVVEKMEDNTFVIRLHTQAQLFSCCYAVWRTAQREGLIDLWNTSLISALVDLRLPRKTEIFKASYEKKEVLEQVLHDLIDLGLIIEHGEYSFNPELFKDVDKSSLDLITEYDILPDQFMESLESVARIPGLPIETMDKRIQDALMDIGRVGILVPVAVESPNSPTKHFVFADPKEKDNGNLSYETAAYFRFNECYAIPKLGRLTDVQAFLKKLLENGRAGDATNIGYNYRPIELKGVISIVEGFTSGRFMMTMRKRGVISEARSLLAESCEDVLHWKEPPIWVSDPAATRAAQAKRMEKSMADLMKLLRDMG